MQFKHFWKADSERTLLSLKQPSFKMKFLHSPSSCLLLFSLATKMDFASLCHSRPQFSPFQHPSSWISVYFSWPCQSFLTIQTCKNVEISAKKHHEDSLIFPPLNQSSPCWGKHLLSCLSVQSVCKYPKSVSFWWIGPLTSQCVPAASGFSLTLCCLNLVWPQTQQTSDLRKLNIFHFDLPITSICLKVCYSSKERNHCYKLEGMWPPVMGGWPLVNPVVDDRTPFSALPSPYGPWEEKERRKKEKEIGGEK